MFSTVNMQYGISLFMAFFSDGLGSVSSELITLDRLSAICFNTPY